MEVKGLPESFTGTRLERCKCGHARCLHDARPEYHGGPVRKDQAGQELLEQCVRCECLQHQAAPEDEQTVLRLG